MDIQEAESLLSFLSLVGDLKKVRRQGWVLCGISNPETVAEHMYRMAMCCFLLPDTMVIEGVQQPLNKTRCIKMALVHDLGEALVGDITPHCGISDDQKYELEKNALQKIKGTLDSPSRKGVGEEIEVLWKEYEAGNTVEAIVVKDIDKFEMILQAHEYECENATTELQCFFDSTAGRFRTDFWKSLESVLRAKREKKIDHGPPGSNNISTNTEK